MTSTVESALRVGCDREDLVTALQTADAIVPSNSAKPILTNLQLVARDGLLEIVATDLQVGLRAILRKIDVQVAGEVVVPARQLVSILKESRSPTVLLVLESNEGGSHLRVDLADGDYRVPAVLGETFPTVSTFPADEQPIAITGTALDRMIRKTAFAVDRDRTSAVLSGVFFKVGDGECLLAATDGKVLAEAVHSADAFAGVDCQAIIPAVTIGHLNRIVGSAKPEHVEFAITGKLVCVRVVTGGIQVELTSRLVEGSYPSYRNALPTDPQATVVFDTKELASGVRRTALMTSNASRAIVLDIGPGETILSNLNNTSGSARIPVGCEYGGSKDRLGVNVNYLAEVLKAFDSDSISFELNGPGRGLLAREEGVTFLIMPITLPN